MDKHLQSYLQQHHISYKLHEHAPVFTVEQSHHDPVIQKIPGVRTKNLFLKDERGHFYLVCMPGEKRLNIRALEKHLRVKKLQFASPEELKAELHLTPGSVSLFGMLYAAQTTLLLDRAIAQAPIISFHPNINTATIELTQDALTKFLATLTCKQEVIDLA